MTFKNLYLSAILILAIQFVVNSDPIKTAELFDAEQKGIGEIVDISYDESKIVTAYKTAIVWDKFTGEKITTFREFDRLIPNGFTNVPGYISCSAFSPDGTLVVSGGPSALAYIWDARTGEVIHRIRLYPEDEVATNLSFAAAFSPDGRQVALTDGTKLCIYDLTASKIDRCFDNILDFKELQYADSSHLVGVSGSTILVLNPIDGNVYHNLDGLNSLIYKDVIYILRANGFGKKASFVETRNLKSGELVNKSERIVLKSFTFRISSDGKYAVQYDPDGEVYEIIGLDTGEVIQTFDLDNGEPDKLGLTSSSNELYRSSFGKLSFFDVSDIFSMIKPSKIY